MGRTAQYDVKNTAKGWQVNIPPKFSSTGTRQRRFFETRVEAEGFVHSLGAQIENYGLSTQLLKPTEAEEAKAAIRLLEEAGASVGLLGAVRNYLAHERRRSESRTVESVIDLFMGSKRRSAKYADSLERTKTRMKPLHSAMASDVTPNAIEALLKGVADTYRNALLREIRAIFAFAVKRGWCAANPVARMDFARVRIGEREVYSVAESAAILETAERHDPTLLPFFAIGLFAGIRVYELLRLEWKNVDIEEGSIDLPASITKRERRRSVPIEPALRAWLERAIWLNGIPNGYVCPLRTYNALRVRQRLLFKTAKVQWRQNAARHSFASYWLAEHGDLTALALRLGHAGGLEVLHTHYHRAVRKADAVKFWANKPAAGDRKIVPAAFSA